MAHVVCGQYDRCSAADSQAAAVLDCEPAFDDEAVGNDEAGSAVDSEVANNVASGGGRTGGDSNGAANTETGVVIGAAGVAVGVVKRGCVEPVELVGPVFVDGAEPEVAVGVGIGRDNDGKGRPSDDGCQYRLESHVGISFFPAGCGHRMWNEPGARPTSVAWRTGYKLGSQRIKQKMVICHM